MESVPPPPPNKITSEEAQKVVALWGERLAQKDAAASMPSIKDLSEALGISEVQVESLLAEVRGPAASSPAKPKSGFSWRATMAAAGAVVVMGALVLGGLAAFKEARMANQPRENLIVPVPNAIELPPFNMDAFADDARALRFRIGDIAWEPLDWGSVRTLTVIGGGIRSELDLQTSNEWTPGSVLLREITRLVALDAEALPPFDHIKLNQPSAREALEEVLNSISVGSNRGWESVFTMKELKLQAGGESVTIRIPVLAFSSLKGIGGGEAASAIQEAVKETQALRIREGLKNLNDQIKRSGQTPASAAPSAFPIILTR
jgi:hypothetical protein